MKKYFKEHRISYVNKVSENKRNGFQICQRKYYDFNLFSTKKIAEKLSYMHRNPVRMGLVKNPEEYKWSSCQFYELGKNVGVDIDPSY